MYWSIVVEMIAVDGGHFRYLFAVAAVGAFDCVFYGFACLMRNKTI